MTTTPQAVEEAAGRDSGEVVARAASYYRRTRYIVVAIIVGSGLWFARDGFYTWPQQNAEVLEAQRRAGKGLVPPHSPTDVKFQKILGIALPPIGLALLAWFLYRSRGEYRLVGDVLHVPGHPPVPLDSIQSLDKTRWDRKGIAGVQYELPGATARTGQILLDDFIYERTPTDVIVERIEKHIAPASPAEPSPDASAGE